MTRRFVRRLGDPVGDADYRMAAWRDLSIATASLVNPYAPVDRSVDIPQAPVGTYYPEDVVTAFNPETGETDIDVISVSVGADARRTLDVSYKKLKDAELARRSGDEKVHKTHFFLAANSMKHAARFLLRDLDYAVAVRAFLNVLRMGDTDPNAEKWLAICLAEVGWPLEAGLWFMHAARDFDKSGNLFEAADCYERAGLAWEAPRELRRRPAGGLADQRLDSTACFRSAKSHFARLGEYDEASRCQVLERDAHARWTWSRARRAELAGMRFLWLYGESPLHALRSIGILWVVCALLFFYTGFQSSGRTVHYVFGPQLTLEGIRDFGTSLYFSAVTLSTLGYGDYAPTSVLSRVWSGLEAFVGVCLIAMLLVSVQRRYVGR